MEVVKCPGFVGNFILTRSTSVDLVVDGTELRSPCDEGVLIFVCGLFQSSQSTVTAGVAGRGAEWRVDSGRNSIP